MIPLVFAAALVDTVALPDDWNSVIIHEWGVVTISEGLLVESVPWQYGNPQSKNDPSMNDRAPVVYFYGSDFHDAEFTVELSSGTFTEMFPAPDAVSPDNSSITWNILNAQNLRGYEIPASSIDEITTLNLTTAESCDIVINRFYLGMVPFNWTL